MKTRVETVSVSVACDMKDCESDSESRYSSDDGPYKAGWRQVNVRILNMYDDRCETEKDMTVCPTCIHKFGRCYTS